MTLVSQFTSLAIKTALIVGVYAIAIRPALAQIAETTGDSSTRYGEVQISRYRTGATITAHKGPIRNIQAMVAVPLVCDEQQVEIVDEDVTSNVEYDYRTLPQGEARQLLLKIPYLPGGQEAHAIITFEVRTRIVLPPKETASLRIPKKPPRQLKIFLGRSPMIDTNHSKVKKLLRKIFADLETPIETDRETADPETPKSELTDWQRVEAIYNHVQDSIEYIEGPDKSAVQTLSDGKGDCQNISALMIALCRTAKIPARIVWVHEHNYVEFCLEDAEGKLHWFPCESSGSRAFGEMPLARTILQKGDNFRVPERPRKKLRYASNFMVAEGLPGSGKPRVRYVQEQL